MYNGDMHFCDLQYYDILSPSSKSFTEHLFILLLCLMVRRMMRLRRENFNFKKHISDGTSVASVQCRVLPTRIHGATTDDYPLGPSYLAMVVV